jgi:pimeloyl-ACP methyl ester carboxylesterase
MRGTDVPDRKLMRARITVIALALAVILSGCSATQEDKAESVEPEFSALAEYEQQRLKWSQCYDDYDCAELRVPIDYDDISVGTFRISVLRAPAKDQDRRLGSIVINPGGPGGSGVDYAYAADYVFSPDITERYDIVGFDPRGVGESEPIYCLTDEELDANFAADAKPDNALELQESLEDSEEFAEKCAENTDYLEHFSTIATARDMDILRAALGEATLNYVGKSYGTYLGTLYAELFPKKVGRFVLDGAVDPNIPMKDQNLTQAIGFDRATTAFIKECLTRADCPFTGTVKEAEATILATLQNATTKPLPQKNPRNNDDRMVTESLILVGIASSLYDDVDGWPKLRQAFTESAAGFGDTFLQLADEYSGRNPNGTFRSNDFDSGAVIDCLDWRDERTTEEFTADVTEFAAKAPIFGPYIAYAGLHCQFLPKPKTQRVANTTTTITTAPIIVIGTIRDPATPYAWSVSLAKIFKGSSLISLDGDGHTGHGRGSACVDNAVDAFLLKGTLPPADLICDLTSIAA